jgi:hypothetical protein
VREARYHAPIGKAATDLTVVRYRKGSQFFCGAGGRYWPIDGVIGRGIVDS